MTDKDSEIEKVRKKDRRPLKPARSAAQQQEQKQRRNAEWLLNRGTEDDLVDYLIELGIAPESEQGSVPCRFGRRTGAGITRSAAASRFFRSSGESFERCSSNIEASPIAPLLNSFFTF